jgi:hypothetical protein
MRLQTPTGTTSGRAPLPTHQSAREHETISVPFGIIHVGEHDPWVRRMFACVIWCRTRWSNERELPHTQIPPLDQDMRARRSWALLIK